MFRLILGFFIGVLLTLYLLIPGKNGPTVLVNGSETQQRQELDQASYKVENLGDKALCWAYKAKDSVSEHIKTQQN